MDKIFKEYKTLSYSAVGALLIMVGIAMFFNWGKSSTPQKYSATFISITPGSNETQYNFSWHSSDLNTEGVIEYTRISGESLNKKSKEINAGLEKTSNGYVKNKAVVTDLEPSSEYSYRLGDGKGNWTEKKNFHTRNPKEFNFLLMGDPQIGSSGNKESDSEGWSDTINKAISMFPNSSFIQTAGDQVENSDSEKEYQGLFKPKILEEIPMATTVGNHDNGALYNYYFNAPNQSEDLGETNESPGNYYFTYGNTLIMNINTNNSNVEEHEQFMEETLVATAKLDIKWKIVVFHHSIYSVGGHASSNDIIELRKNLVPVIDKMEIDAALMAHDHSFARTYQMKNFQPLKNQKFQKDAVINPEGTVYITANSSSGSKYYSLSREEEPYAAVKEQLEVPTFTNVEVKEKSLQFSTYRTDSMTVTDTYKIVKDDSLKVELPGLKNINLETTGSVLPTIASTFYPDVFIELQGTNTEGGPFDILNENIVYRSAPEGRITIDSEGKVEVVDNAPSGKVTVWAEVNVDNKKIVTEKVDVNLVEHIEKEFVSADSQWTYLDNGTDQGTVWRDREFDDSTWKRGNGPFGYPEDEKRPTFDQVNTLVDSGEEEEKYATTYFRTEFTIDDVSSIGNLGLIEFEVDDSVVIYLNGIEIGRFNLPEGDITFTDYLQDISEENIGDESQTEKLYLNEEQLKNLNDGKNILSAEVHQSDPDSSDLFWAMRFATN